MLLHFSTLRNAGDEWCVIVRCKLARNMKCVAGWVLRKTRAACKKMHLSKGHKEKIYYRIHSDCMSQLVIKQFLHVPLSQIFLTCGPNPPSKASRFVRIIPIVSECNFVTSHRLPHRRPAYMAIATDPLNSSAERSQTSSGFGKKEPTKLMPRSRTVSNCLRGECYLVTFGTFSV